VLDLAPIDGGAPSGTCRAIRGYVHVCNGDYGQTSWNGKSQWSYSIEDSSHDGHHIFSCIVLLNDHESVYGEESKLICHELGHCLVSTDKAPVIVVTRFHVIAQPQVPLTC
jgi:hypothetical protein